MNKPTEEANVRLLYKTWIEAWNNQNAKGMSDLVLEDGDIVGFDGSQMKGNKNVYSVIGEIFAAHPTGLYVSIVQEVKFVSDEVAILRAVVGMVPRGGSDINPAVNAIQSLVCKKVGEDWKIALFQNTPAAFHGRPELAMQLTNDLRLALGSMKNGL